LQLIASPVLESIASGWLWQQLSRSPAQRELVSPG
jgi:hypothetical protein